MRSMAFLSFIVSSVDLTSSCPVTPPWVSTGLTPAAPFRRNIASSQERRSGFLRDEDNRLPGLCWRAAAGSPMLRNFYGPLFRNSE